MVREVITVNVGNAGINLGSTIWEQYNLEHSIDDKENNKYRKDNSFQTFYQESSDGKFKPINLMIDLEPDAINDLKQSKYASIYNDEYLLSHNDGGCGIFARGHCTVGKQMMDEINDSLRKLVEDCDAIQGFIMNHSVGGGTGSGLGSLILERLTFDYRKKLKLGVEIYPFNNNYSNNIVEPYNALLSTHFLLDHVEVSMVYDNRQIYNLCKDKLLIQQPTYSHINSLIAKIISSATAALRFEGEKFNEIKTNLVSFPRLCFVISSMAPLIMSDQNRSRKLESKQILVDGFVRQNAMIDYNVLYADIMNMIYSIYDINVNVVEDRLSLQELSEDIYNYEYFSIECLDFDIDIDVNNETWMIYRGDIKSKDANATRQWLLTNRKVSFDGLSITGFKVGMNETLCPLLPRDLENMKMGKKQGVMMETNTCIRRFFNERISNVFDKMYSQRAFVHWFLAEGMEEGELLEAREDLGFLEKDYLDLITEQATDESDETDD